MGSKFRICISFSKEYIGKSHDRHIAIYVEGILLRMLSLHYIMFSQRGPGTRSPSYVSTGIGQLSFE